LGEEDKNMNNENRNEEAVSPVIATILMVAITVVLAGVLYVWASSLAGDSTGDGLDTYQFDGRDAAGTITDDISTADELVYVKMTQGKDLSWSQVGISVIVDGGQTYECEKASDNNTADCVFTQSDGKEWDTPYEMLISEGASNICAPTAEKAYCSLEVIITKIGVGGDDSKILQEVTAIAEA
jgi:flagellin-like protein